MNKEEITDALINLGYIDKNTITNDANMAFRIDFYPNKAILGDCTKQFMIWLKNSQGLKILDVCTWPIDNRNHSQPVVVGNLKELIFKKEMDELINGI